MRSLARMAVVLCASCGGQRAPVEAAPPTSPSVALPTITEPDPTVPTAPETPALPTEIVEPEQIACRIMGKGWSDRLRLRLKSAPFMSTVNAPATLVLPVTTTPTEAIVSIDDGSLLLRGVLPANEVGFYLAKPTALLGIVTPEADTALGWVSSSDGSARLGLATDSVLLTPDLLQVDSKCDALAIVPGTYVARDSITKQKPTQLVARDVARDGVELRPSPGAPPSGTLRGGIEVGLVANKGAETRILIEPHQGFLVSGWVAKKDLVPAAGGVWGALGKPGQYLERFSKFYENLTHCAADVDVFIEQGTDRMKVGLIHKESRFRPMKDAEAATHAPTFVSVEVPGSNWFSLEKDVRLVVESASIEECRVDARGF